MRPERQIQQIQQINGTNCLKPRILANFPHSATDRQPRRPMLPLPPHHILSLSHPITPEMPCWPGDPPVTLTPVAHLDREGYGLRELRISEHGGTHVNAPASFVAGGMGIADYPAAHWVRSAVVIGGRSPARKDPDWALDRDTVIAWEAEHGRIPPGSLVLLNTGWGDRWGDPAAFLNADAAGRLHFPSIDPATAQWLLDTRAIAGIGIDTPGVDPGWSPDFATNRRVLAAGGIVIECLANLDPVPPVGATLVIGVLPLVGGSGSPAAILALWAKPPRT